MIRSKVLIAIACSAVGAATAGCVPVLASGGGGSAPVAGIANRAPICMRTTFTISGPGKTDAIHVMDFAADPDRQLLTLSVPSQPPGGTVTVGDNGTPGETSDDVLLYRRTSAATLRGGYADTIFYVVSDGERSVGCSASADPPLVNEG